MPKPGLDLFAKTEPPAPDAPRPAAPPPSAASDRIVSIGVGLRLSEIAALDAEAARRGISRNALIRGILRDAMQGKA